MCLIPPKIFHDPSYTLEMERYNKVAQLGPVAYNGFKRSKPSFRASIIRELIAEKCPQSPDEFVEIGPGFGHLQALMLGFERVAIDQSIGFLRYIKNKMPEVFCINAVAEFLPFPDESVECLVSDSTFQSVNNRIRFLYEIGRVTAPGALAILSIAYKWNYPRKPQDGFNVNHPDEIDILKRFIEELAFDAEYRYMSVENRTWVDSKEDGDYLWIIGRNRRW